MAILRDNIAPTSSSSTILSQFSQDMNNFRLEKERKAEKDKREREQKATYRGQATAEIGSLSSFPGLQNVAQGMYQEYIRLEDEGDIEGAAMVKAQLNKQLNAFAGYTENFINQRRNIDDVDVQAGFVTPYSDMQSIADEYQNAQYEYVGFRDGKHIVKNADGEEMDVNAIPGVGDGTTFLDDERVIAREKLPEGYKDVYDMASLKGSKLLTNDVVDQYGRITNEEELRSKVDDSADEYFRRNEGQLLNMIYLDQREKGNMDRYNDEEIRRILEEEPELVEQLKEGYKNDLYNQITSSINRTDSPEESTAKEKSRFVKNITVKDNELVFADKPLRFDVVSEDDEGNEVPTAMYILGIRKNDQGLPVMVNSVIEGEVGSGATKKTKEIPIRPGTPEYRGLVDEFGGEEYLMDALKRAGIDMDFYQM